MAKYNQLMPIGYSFHNNDSTKITIRIAEDDNIVIEADNDICLCNLDDVDNIKKAIDRLAETLGWA